MKARRIGKYLVMDPRVCFGKLTFKGSRLPVEIVLYHLAKGKSIESILKDWPYLEREAVSEAITLSRRALLERYGSKSLFFNERIRRRKTPAGQCNVPSARRR
jgi:uncharacterized protein (DUF433 family)